MYVNLSNDSQYATDDLGVYFSDTIVSGINYSYPPPFIPQIENITGTFISDTMNWVSVSGDYIASGGEGYIIIGNYKFDSSTDTIAVNSNPLGQFAYIYIDDVSLTRTQACSVGQNDLIKESKKYILYPNPFSSNTILEFENSKSENHTLVLFDSQGRLVRTITNIVTDKVVIERQTLSDGLYFFQLCTDREVIATGKMKIEQ
jgi:Secretion system C-terminal sorting domain